MNLIQHNHSLKIQFRYLDHIEKLDFSELKEITYKEVTELTNSIPYQLIHFVNNMSSLQDKYTVYESVYHHWVNLVNQKINKVNHSPTMEKIKTILTNLLCEFYLDFLSVTNYRIGMEFERLTTLDHQILHFLFHLPVESQEHYGLQYLFIFCEKHSYLFTIDMFQKNPTLHNIQHLICEKLQTITDLEFEYFYHKHTLQFLLQLYETCGVQPIPEIVKILNPRMNHLLEWNRICESTYPLLQQLYLHFLCNPQTNPIVSSIILQEIHFCQKVVDMEKIIWLYESFGSFDYVYLMIPYLYSGLPMNKIPMLQSYVINESKRRKN